ncbi:MAG: hypothetical protein Q7S30_03340 [Candidatus Omnitrophota bacterium]|nr:hypothetical protein [Candidatus Omnitrophota bacterium]
MLNHKVENRKIYAVMCAISACLILSSIKDIWNFSHFERYQFIFQYLPQETMLLRYKISIVLRVATIIVAAGVLFRKDIFRKLMIWGSLFTIATIYWKHPLDCYKHIFKKMAELGLMQPSLLRLSDLFSWTMMICHYMLDISIAIGIIYFFTRPYVKTLFYQSDHG